MKRIIKCDKKDLDMRNVINWSYGMVENKIYKDFLIEVKPIVNTKENTFDVIVNIFYNCLNYKIKLYSDVEVYCSLDNFIEVDLEILKTTYFDDAILFIDNFTTFKNIGELNNFIYNNCYKHNNQLFSFFLITYHLYTIGLISTDGFITELKNYLLKTSKAIL